MTRPFLAAMAASVLALAGCFDDRVAGGTDEVENPALTISLVDQAQSASGSVKVYARFHNPVKDSAPLLSLPVPESGVKVVPKTLVAAMEAAFQAGLPWKNRDSITFNLVGAKDAEEAFASDFLLLKTGTSYVWKHLGRSRSVPVGDAGLSFSLALETAKLDYQGNVGPRGKELGIQSIFVPGSPYLAAVAGDGSFTVARIAAGRYEVKGMDKDGKVWSSQDSLATSVPFVPADWSEADIIWVD